MKRFLGIGIIISVSFLIFTACGDNSHKAIKEQNQFSIKQQEEDSLNISFGAESFATGVGIITSTKNSFSASEYSNGWVQVDSAITTITVDSNGIIVDAVIDASQSRVEFNAYGEIVTPLDTPMPTKVEQGLYYGMEIASGIDAEWYQQVNNLTDWMIGRPIHEVVNMPLTDENRPVDLASYVTINVSPTITAIEKASENLILFDASNNNIRTGMGIDTIISGSRQISDVADARIDVTTSVVSLILDDNDVILASFIDSPQSRVHLNDEGEINPNDIIGYIPTRGQLREAYNMKPASPINMEWYQQIESLSEWMIGKTVSEVRGLSVSEDSIIEDTDLTSSVTISVNSIMTAFNKAVENANR